jgi:DNA-3-methyladenine glycosylase
MLPLSFFEQETTRVAQQLLGMELVCNTEEGVCSGVIVETEAYLANDPASHSYAGPTKRNRSMFGPAGTAYVYQIYGLHYCFNVVTGRAGEGEAVLIRALEPKIGQPLMRQRRESEILTSLCSGPAKLVQALGITPELDGTPLTSDRIYLLKDRELEADQIITTTRIGISKAAEAPLRFYIKNSPYTSR